MTPTSGETLDGQRLNDDARFTGRPRAGQVIPTDGGYTVVVSRHSAAMITVDVAGTTLTGPAAG